jgi:hypothetical protein
MNATYDVGQNHWFIRITNSPEIATPSHDLLETDVEKLRWLNPVEDIEMVNLHCYSHTHEAGRHVFRFRDAKGKSWTSLPQEFEDKVEWRIIKDGSPSEVFTAYRPVQAYVLSMVHNGYKKHPQWVVDRAKIFQSKLDILNQQINSVSNGWGADRVHLGKPNKNAPIPPLGKA